MDMFLPGLGNGPIDFMAESLLHNIPGWCLSVFGACLLALGCCCLGVTAAGSTAGGVALAAVILSLSAILRLTLSETFGQFLGSIPLEHSTWTAVDGFYTYSQATGISMSMLSGLYDGCIGIVCCAIGYVLYCSGKREKALRGRRKKI